MVVKVLLKCAIRFFISSVRISEFLYANCLTFTCVRCTHLLKTWRDHWGLLPRVNWASQCVYHWYYFPSFPVVSVTPIPCHPWSERTVSGKLPTKVHFLENNARPASKVWVDHCGLFIHSDFLHSRCVRSLRDAHKWPWFGSNKAVCKTEHSHSNRTVLPKKRSKSSQRAIVF